MSARVSEPQSLFRPVRNSLSNISSTIRPAWLEPGAAEIDVALFFVAQLGVAKDADAIGGIFWHNEPAKILYETFAIW